MLPSRIPSVPTLHPSCLVHPVLKLPITHQSVVTAIDISISRQSPLVGRGFQGTPDLPVIGSWRARKTNKSGAEQIWLLTYFAGHPSLISVSPSIICLSTIHEKASREKKSLRLCPDLFSTKLTALHEFIGLAIPDLGQ
ncbi:Uncharacterized protein HZ326_0447 [Fusarium oxysporum f. sp. albedinis]|nr:Uncharacterized protein HZ326_0447 [Fusarium oxysporum f. sp. albedinis]